jgi:hypothetical protein
MIYSLTVLKPFPPAVGFVEFTTAGVNQAITSSMIPSGVIKVRVHLIGAGGGWQNSNSGGSSAFSVNSTSVIATGGLASFQGNGTMNGWGGNGGSISAVSGVIAGAARGMGAYTAGNSGNSNGTSGGYNASLGVSMGGGGGGSSFQQLDESGWFVLPGAGGSAGTNSLRQGQYSFGGSGGGDGQTIPFTTYSNFGGAGSDGVSFVNNGGGGGAGAYAIFLADLNGATNYPNAITVGAAGNGAQGGYCRIEWGPSIT